MENAACSSGGMTTSGLVAPMPGLLFPEAAHAKANGSPRRRRTILRLRRLPPFGPCRRGGAPRVGETNIIFLDERNVRVTSLNIVVEEGAASRVKIHNKKLLTSFTVYRCSENRCEYVDEVAAKEPAELPRGHLNQNQSVNENINSTTTDQTPR